MTIRATLWDWGGVLQRTEDPSPRRALEARLGLPPGGLEQAVFDSPVWGLASTGQCSADDAWEAIASSLDVPGEEIDALVTCFFAGDRVDERLVAIIRHLRGEGIAVGLLSNAPPGRTRGNAAARWGMEGLFDAQVFSYEVGVLKPDARMYRAGLAALGVAAHEVVFIDDSPANIAGARALGIDALLFRAVPALIAELSARGLPVPHDV